MMQKRSKAHNSHGAFSQSAFSRFTALLMLSLMGSTGILASGLTIARASEADVGAIPSAEDLLAPVTSTPARAEVPRFNRPSAEVSPPQEPAPSPVAESAAPSPAPVSTQAETTAPAIAQPNSSPSPVVVPNQAPVAPAETAETPASTEDPGQRALTDFSENYIDPTQYDVGATRSDQPTVVFSERSTGCEQSVQSGQAVPDSICRAIQARVANEQQQAGATGGAAGAPASTAASSTAANGQSRSAANPLSIQSFYNRTVRPLAVAGNGNANIMYPLSIPAAISSVFGWRIHPISGDRRFHYGTDLAAPTGTPVVAAKSGRVDIASFLGGYGLTVVVHHEDGREQSLYAHLSEIFVRPGEQVNQGEVIGRVGSTGNSTGPHLHFEFRERTTDGWVALDPGLALQAALAQMVNGFRLAQLPLPEFELNDKMPFSFAVTGLQDFGKLASDVLPEVSIAPPGSTPVRAIAAIKASEETVSDSTSALQPQGDKVVEAAEIEDDLPEVRIKATVE